MSWSLFAGSAGPRSFSTVRMSRAVLLAGGDGQPDRLGGSGDPVLDRILDQRLEDERRHPGGAEVGGHVDPDVEALGEARFLDVEIELLELDLLGEGDVLARIEREARAEEGGEVDDHRLRFLVAPRHDQRGERVQGVEQEVRVDLVAKRPELRLLGVALGAGGPALGGSKPGGRADRDVEARPGGEEEIPGDEAVGDQPEHELALRWLWSVGRAGNDHRAAALADPDLGAAAGPDDRGSVRALADDGALDQRLVDGEGEVEGREDRRRRNAGDGGGDDLDPDALARRPAEHEIDEEGEDDPDQAAERPRSRARRGFRRSARCG